MNLQLSEKRIYRSDKIQVHSVFHTIQGEGPFAGRPALFVRLAGCNLQCPACDTDYTGERVELGHGKLITHVLENLKNRERVVVITGGEPFRQPIATVVMGLLNRGLDVQLETNGTLFDPMLSTIFNYHLSQRLTIVCSPKTQTLNKELYPHISVFKYVVKYGEVDSTDGLPTKALDHPCSTRVCRPPKNFPKERIYVQPLDEDNITRNQFNMTTATDSCMKHGYTLCLQLHKIIGLP